MYKVFVPKRSDVFRNTLRDVCRCLSTRLYTRKVSQVKTPKKKKGKVTEKELRTVNRGRGHTRGGTKDECPGETLDESL